jgi:hypothetical protein
MERSAPAAKAAGFRDLRAIGIRASGFRSCASYLAQVLEADDSLGDAPHRDVRLEERVDEAIAGRFRRTVLLQDRSPLLSGQLIELTGASGRSWRLVQNAAECLTHVGCDEESELVLVCEHAGEEESRAVGRSHAAASSSVTLPRMRPRIVAPQRRPGAQLRLAASAEPLEPLARLGVEPVADTASRALLLDLLVTGRLELGKEAA